MEHNSRGGLCGEVDQETETNFLGNERRQVLDLAVVIVVESQYRKGCSMDGDGDKAGYVTTGSGQSTIKGWRKVFGWS